MMRHEEENTAADADVNRLDPGFPHRPKSERPCLGGRTVISPSTTKPRTRYTGPPGVTGPPSRCLLSPMIDRPGSIRTSIPSGTTRVTLPSTAADLNDDLAVTDDRLGEVEDHLAEERADLQPRGHLPSAAAPLVTQNGGDPLRESQGPATSGRDRRARRRPRR